MAVGVSLGGSENSVLHVVDVASGKLLSESISLTEDAQPSWVDDDSGFYFSRLQPIAEGAPASTKYDNMRVYFHRLGTPDKNDTPVFGPDVVKDPALPKNGFVGVSVMPGTQMLLAGQSTGVVETPAFWVRRTADGPWVKVIGHADGLLQFALHGTHAYVMTKSGAGGAVSNGRVVGFDVAKETFAEAKIVVPESDRILSAGSGTGIAAASDALYVFGFRDGLGVILRVPYDKPSSSAELKLPVTGTVEGVAADVRRSGAEVAMSGWATPRLVYAYSPDKQSFTDTGLQPRNPIDMSAITSKEVQAMSADGTMVPLSILYRKDLQPNGANPALLTAYGTYGYTVAPAFASLMLPWLNRGGVYAVAHVRGGGERGEVWHLAGMKTTKQHTIDDFVACAQYLIDQKYTSPEHFGIDYLRRSV